MVRDGPGGTYVEVRVIALLAFLAETLNLPERRLERTS